VIDVFDKIILITDTAIRISIVDKLGTANQKTVSCINLFYQALTKQNDQEVEMLYREWLLFFEDTYGKVENLPIKRTLFKDLYQLEDDYDLRRLFFAIHTYYSIVIKLITFAILAKPRNSGVVPHPDLGSDLFHFMEGIENGKAFRKLKIANFADANLFDWYLTFWNDEIQEIIRAIIDSVASFLDANDAAGRGDLLKSLYQDLIPKQIRHALGEYYTPDWLADLIIESANCNFALENRFLDPSCGSGTFLVRTILKIRKFNEDKYEGNFIVNKILNNVVGFDLNPLAVLTTKANYAIMISDIIKTSEEDHFIPVYLCDSTLIPRSESGLSGMTWLVRTPWGKLESTVAPSKGYVNRILSSLELSFQKQKGIVKERKELSSTLDDQIFKILNVPNIRVKLFRIQYIMECCEPIWQERFDYVLGNPSWINWDSLPETYRETVFPVYHDYGLLRRGSSIGAIKIDFCVLATYVALHKFLKVGGVLGFALTQTVFASRASEGFRTFVLPDRTPLKVISVHDFVEMQPFEGAINRTATIVIKKGEKNEYPVSYHIWKSKEGNKVSFGDSFDEVKSKTEITAILSRPVNDDMLSPWVVGNKKLLSSLYYLTRGAQQYYRSREGVNTGGANALFWIEIANGKTNSEYLIRNFAETGRKSIPAINPVPVESDLVYPLIRGRNIDRWEVNPSGLYIVVPHTKESGMEAISEIELKSKYPKTFGFLNHPKLKPVLRNRRAVTHRWGGTTRWWYSLFEIGPYTFAPYKVCYKGEVATKLAAVVVNSSSDDKMQNKLTIPDQTIHFIPCEDEDEAHYVCAVMNSKPYRELYACFRYKHPSTFILEYGRIPRFTKASDIHSKLCMLSKHAHGVKTGEISGIIEKVESEIDMHSEMLFKQLE
jgi:hypothetical protein